MLKVFGRFVLTLALASIVIFLLLRAVPGDPARVALGVNATDEAVRELSSQLGLDRPLFAQYGEWVGNLLRGDFGVSLASQENISAELIDRGLVSLILVGLAMLLSLAIAIPVGVWTARHHNDAGGTAVTALTQLGIAIPSFLVGILLVAVFAVGLGWLPANGWVIPGDDFGAFASRLVLPVIALALVQGAMLTRYVRSAVLDAMSQDYIRTARALGQSPTQALFRHGLRNAALPVLTVAGVQLTTLVVGAVVIENVFVLPGLGSMLLEAVTDRDLTTVQSIVMVLVTFTLLINLLVDMAYRAIDPRLGSHTRSEAR